MENPYSVKYRWMRWLTNPILRQDSIVKGVELDDDKKLVANPFSFLDGTDQWGFVSNGSAMILVRGFVGWRDLPEQKVDMIRSYTKKEITGNRVDFGEFKKWAGAGWSATLPCHACNGDWAKSCAACFGIGQVDRNCGHCDEKHRCNCGACKGQGTLFCERCVGGKAFVRRPGRIGKALVDMGLVARFIAHADVKPHGQVRIMNEGAFHPVWIESEEKDWRVVVMPLRDTHLPERDIPQWK